MILEIRILCYWLCLLSFFYVVAKLDHHFSRTSIRFKYYESLTCTIYEFLRYVGSYIIVIWILMQFTNYFFKGEFVFINNLN